MSRFTRVREVATSSATTGAEAFLPRRLLNSEPVALLQRVAIIPAKLINTSRNLVRAAETIPVLVAKAQVVLDNIEILVSRVADVSAGAAMSVESVDAICVEANAAMRCVQQLEARVEILVGRCEPVLAAASEVDPDLVRATRDLMAQLQPVLTAMTSLSADTPAQAAALLSRSGPLLDQIDTIMMPLLGELHDAVPDVRDILPVVQRLEPVMVDVETRIAGLPGADRLLRRGERVIEDATSDGA
jgi:hypothetical protein